jgi:prolyl oligopeptidase
LLAYERKEGGEDKKSIHVLNVETGVTLRCCIERGNARGFAFTPDNRGFFYCQELSTDGEEHTIRLHLFYESMPDQVVFSVARSRGSRLVLVADSIHLGAIWVHDVDGKMLEDFWLAKKSDAGNWRRVFGCRELPFSPILKNGRLFAVSNDNAPNGKVSELSQEGEEIHTIVPGQERTVQQFVINETAVCITTFSGLRFGVRSWSLEGRELPEITLPDDGTVRVLPDIGHGESLFLSYESFTQPPTIYEYNPVSSALKVWYERPPCQEFVPVKIRSTTYSSIDGTKIPITLVGRSVPSDGETPVSVVMTSYGGFGVAMTPQFSVLVALLLERGALFAVPHVRGGGEFGKTWHDAGRRRDKRTSVDDFVAAADWLCREGITSPLQLGIFGGSNSGLLVGAAMTQRPDLFAAVLCIAPLLDMVRYEFFDQAVKWRREYGGVDDPEDFLALYGCSPYHHIAQKVDYPAVLFVSGDKDDRCNPAHVRKMAARLQERDAQRSAVVVDYSEQRGHSPVLPLSVRVEALAKRVAFLCRELNLPVEIGERHEPACD